MDFTARWIVQARKAARYCSTRRRASCVPFVRVIFGNAADAVANF